MKTIFFFVSVMILASSVVNAQSRQRICGRDYGYKQLISLSDADFVERYQNLVNYARNYIDAIHGKGDAIENLNCSQFLNHNSSDCPCICKSNSESKLTE